LHNYYYIKFFKSFSDSYAFEKVQDSKEFGLRTVYKKDDWNPGKYITLEATIFFIILKDQFMAGFWLRFSFFNESCD